MDDREIDELHKQTKLDAGKVAEGLGTLLVLPAVIAAIVGLVYLFTTLS